MDYLLKPFSLARFLKACNKAQELWRLRGQNTAAKDFVFLKTGYEQVRIAFDDILYLEAAGNYVTFVLEGKKLLSRMTMAEVETLLPAEKFVRIHRSYVVAKDKIDRVERHQVRVHGHALPLGVSYAKQLKW